MLFNSLDFLIFLPIVMIVLWIIPKSLRQWWLLICSYFFYMCWEPKYIVLIVGSTVITYLSAIMMEKADGRYKKLSMVLCIVLNLGLLFVFKYLNFTMDTIAFFTRTAPRHFNIILPVGISFYTFQALGYTIDCYRGKTKVEHNFMIYALFVSFFPQLVAGPIERSGNLLHQLKELRQKPRHEMITGKGVRDGLILVAYGMFMKIVIADRLAILVDSIYSNVNLYGTVGLFMAFIGFPIQIYCDFGSYSTIAIGVARMMGITLMENFDAPFFATSITDVWRRWHISLSSWFRDYVYIPLGGSRKGIVRKYFNLFIIFLLSGLWHGASWTYVFWGASQGLIIVIENIIRPYWHRVEEQLGVDKSSVGFMFCRNLMMLFLFDLSAIFFRANTFPQAFTFIRRLFTRPDFWVLSTGEIYNYGLDVMEMWIIVTSVMILLVMDFIRVRQGLTFDKWISTQFVGFRILFMLVIVMMTIVFGQYGPGFNSEQFIYFQF
ncbi:MAG: MBOAT family protein [Butyrivibrio sp.]|nr:MBOAT family protein [Butyrivibrio sp.]